MNWFWLLEREIPAAETLRRIAERLKELKSLKRRIAKLEKWRAEYQEELRQRRLGALEREQSLLKWMSEIAGAVQALEKKAGNP
jgi:DNA repair exonuclease SbcCD ATPase subunit